MNEAITQQAAFIRDYGTKLCNCRPFGNGHEPHCLGARHIEVAETLESLATRPIPSTEAEGLAGELESVLPARASNGDCHYSLSLDLRDRILTALRNSPSPDRGGVPELLRQARGYVHGNHDEGCELDPEYGEQNFNLNYEAEIEADIDAERDWPDDARCTCGTAELLAQIDTALANTPQAGPTEAGDAVAWLYESEDGSKELILDCNGEYARWLLEHGYTEMPLYALRTPAGVVEAEGEARHQAYLRDLSEHSLESGNCSEQYIWDCGFDAGRDWARSVVGGDVETIASIIEWGDETFGPCSADRAVKRAEEELAEYWDEQEPEKKPVEAADAIICLLHVPGIAEAIQRKMTVNRARKWRLMGDGTGYHVPAALSGVQDTTKGDGA